MRFGYLLLLFVFSVPLAYAQDYSVSKRIVGGVEINDTDKSFTSIQQWPWIVALIDQNNGLRCGASLISRQWLMTAAHCLYGSNGQVDQHLLLTAIFQQPDLDQLNPESISRSISHVVIHPQYSYYSNDNDIALLRLETAVDGLEAVRLPGRYIETPVVANGTSATVLGWGTNQPSVLDARLRMTALPIADPQDCAAAYSPFGIDINSNMLCAGFEQGGHDACSGDSGGPLVVPHESGTGWKQLGIVSFGIGCALPDFFGVYTRVSRYNDFIEGTICERQPEKPELSVSRDNNQLIINLTSATDEQQEYRIYYAPYPIPVPVQHYDLVGRNSVSTEIAENRDYYIVGQQIEDNCSSAFSNIATTRLPPQ